MTSETEHLPTSAARFADGAAFRVEIPSVEGVAALEAVVDERARRGVPVHRASQGSGVGMLTDEELRRMAELGQAEGIEVSLFHHRAAWDAGVQASSSAGRIVAGAVRGPDQLRFAVQDVAHACDLGIRSVLVSDLGLLATLAEQRRAGALPEDLVLKVSASLPVANPATARVLEDLGADTLNLVVDLSLSTIAAIRAATSLPLDVYVEAPDDFGGVVRLHEIPELVRVAAPIYLKFGVRNHGSLYPAGGHMEDLVVRLARERVRRAEVGLGILRRASGAALPVGGEVR